jgi:exopolysaccharide production protein ExoQ
LCAISTVWSDDHIWTLKASAELALTVLIGIAAATLIKPHVLMASLMSALIFIALLCISVGFQNGATGIGASAALQGIFHSKNVFSVFMCLLLMISIVVVSDKGHQPDFLRLIAFGSIITTPFLLLLGRSIGAMIAVMCTLAIFGFMRLLARLGHTTRLLATLAVLGTVLAGGVAVSITESSPLALIDLLGKDSTLTGRTYLWQKAEDDIAERPIQGVGYRAFWRIGNPRAEQLWYEFYVPAGPGFNFHNEYLEMLVELGIIGLVLMVGTFIVIGLRVASTAMMIQLAPECSFAILTFIFFIFRSPVEVQLFDQFNIGIVLICLIWNYVRPQQVRERQSRPFELNTQKVSNAVQ